MQSCTGSTLIPRSSSTSCVRYTQRIWSGFSREERLRFAKDYAARWNVFRHRIAPDIYSQITSSQLTGQLQVHAGSIEKLRRPQTGSSSNSQTVHR